MHFAPNWIIALWAWARGAESREPSHSLVLASAFRFYSKPVILSAARTYALRPELNIALWALGSGVRQPSAYSLSPSLLLRLRPIPLSPLVKVRYFCTFRLLQGELLVGQRLVQAQLHELQHYRILLLRPPDLNLLRKIDAIIVVKVVVTRLGCDGAMCRKSIRGGEADRCAGR